MKKLTHVTVNFSISTDIIDNLLCNAFEGGSTYWAHSAADNRKEENIPADYCYEVALYRKGKVTLEHDSPHTGEIIKTDLTIKEIESGLSVFAQKYPKHFGDAISGNDDAETADIFLQCCLFGELFFS